VRFTTAAQLVNELSAAKNKSELHRVREQKKKENGGLAKLTPLMGIRKERGFRQRLGKHQALSTVTTRPDGGSIEGLDSPAGRGQ
jgi:hypothetical protein